jgi:hypothetical protein
MVEKVSFTGNLDISKEMPKGISEKSMSSGGPIDTTPETNRGATAPTGIEQTEGPVPKGGNIVFPANGY